METEQEQEEPIDNGTKRKNEDHDPKDDPKPSKNNFEDVGIDKDSLEDNKGEDLELKAKSDREIVDFISRFRRNLVGISGKLPDGGAKLKANLQRHEVELERRKKVQLEKAANGCDETVHLSDHSEDGASHVKKKSSSKFASLLCKKMTEDKDSRTVYAFEEDLSCQGKILKLDSQVSGKGRSRKGKLKSKVQTVGSKRLIISNGENKDGDSTTSFLESNSPKDTPSRNLRPRTTRSYHLVDEESAVEKFIKNLDPCMKDVIVYYPSRDDSDAVEVNYNYMECLAPETYISSVIMNFYIRYLQRPSSSSESATCHYHFFNTYFYNKLLLEKPNYKEDSFLKLRKWWKNVNIFEKAYILLPVHDCSHWSLVIVCLPDKEDELGPVLLHLDSLGLHDSKSLFDNIKGFLKEEWNYLRKSETYLDPPITDEIWENLDTRVFQKKVLVPQQKNDYDCGLFVLYYMERFIKEAPARFRKKDLSMFGRQWFRSEEASNLRGKIYDLLVEEFKKAKANESTSSPKS